MNKVKKAVSALAIMFACVISANAEVENADVANSTSSVSVSISSSALSGDITNVDSSCTPGRKAVEIQNLDASANMFCGFVSSTVSRTVGRKITPGATWVVGVRCYDFNGLRIRIYCVNDSAAAITAWITALGNK